MASSKIKRKASSDKTSAMPRQAAIPCLILLAIIFLILGLFVFFGLRSAG
ncbi:MAG TPA: hypothetical protein VH351_23365 [Bryobacteraceae bacterium]|jgi:hypothetical protein|nr:hypothetical protein [Bryobacteraceae bacterium]